MLHNSHLDLFKTVMVVKTIISICNVYSKSFKIICKTLSQIYHHNKWFQPKLVFITISDSLFTITHKVSVIRVQSHARLTLVSSFCKRGLISSTKKSNEKC